MNPSPKNNQQSTNDFNERVLSRIAESKATYWFGFICDPLTVAFLVCWDMFVLRSGFYATILSYLAGLFVWTLVEYGFHRFVYHKGETLAHAGHQMHHDEPEALIGMPWFLTAGVMYSLWFALSYWLQLPSASTFLSGLLSGFIFYYTFHHIHHHFSLKNSWYRKLRAHHKIHHQIPGVNFSVTNRFWDQVFGTTYRKSEAPVKKKNVATHQKTLAPAVRSEAATEVRARAVSVSQT